MDDIIKILVKNNFKALYILEKPLADAFNIHKPDQKINYNKITIATNAKEKDLVNLFPEISNNNILSKDFTYTFKYYEKSDLDNNLYDINLAKDFTLNTLVKDCNDNIIDFNFKHRNKTISAIEDIKHKLIRCINYNRNYIDGKVILKAIYYASKYDFIIEPQTLKLFKKNIDLVHSLSNKDYILLLNLILKEKYLKKGIDYLNELNVFDKPNHEFLKDLDFTILYDKNTNLKTIEIWTLLIKHNITLQNKLLELEYFNKTNIAKIDWLIKHFDIINSNDKLSIYNSREGIVKTEGLFRLKELLLYLCNIHNTLDSNNKVKSERLMFKFYSRPYFYNQIKLKDSEFVKLANKELSYNEMIQIKENFLRKLVLSDKFPKDEKYNKLASEAVNEIILN